jgi:hypothetical protein
MSEWSVAMNVYNNCLLRPHLTDRNHEEQVMVYLMDRNQLNNLLIEMVELEDKYDLKEQILNLNSITEYEKNKTKWYLIEQYYVPIRDPIYYEILLNGSQRPIYEINYKFDYQIDTWFSTFTYFEKTPLRVDSFAIIGKDPIDKYRYTLYYTKSGILKRTILGYKNSLGNKEKDKLVFFKDNQEYETYVKMDKCDYLVNPD